MTADQSAAPAEAGAGRPYRHAYLHIGTTKTGSSALQTELKRRRPDLHAVGFHYAHAVQTHLHYWKALVALKLGRRIKRSDMIVGGSEERARQEVAGWEASLAEEIRSLPANVSKVILSDERMSMSLQDRESVQVAYDLLRPMFDKITVVIYLRSQASLLSSRYAEQLRAGRVDPPDNVTLRPKLMYQYDYKAMLDNWAGVFGEENVIARIYERGVSGNFDAILDFYAAIGLDLPKLPPPPPSNTGANPSIIPAGQSVMVETARLIHAMDLGEEHQRSILAALARAATRQCAGKGWVPTKEEARTFEARFAEGNEDVRRRFFPDRPALFADSLDAYPEAWTPPADAEVARAACKILADLLVRKIDKPETGQTLAKLRRDAGLEPGADGEARGKRGGKGKGGGKGAGKGQKGLKKQRAGKAAGGTAEAATS